MTDELTGRLWRFSNASGTEIVRYMRLHPDGRIGGAGHSNETEWRMDGGDLIFLDQDGNPTSRLAPSLAGFEGAFLPLPSIRHVMTPTTASYPLRFVWSDDCERFAEAAHLYLAHCMRIRGVIRPGQLIEIDAAVYAESEATMPEGQFWSMGAYSYVHQSFGGRASVGRYCSIARGCSVMGDNHPMDRVTAHPFTYFEPFEALARDHYGKDFEGEYFDRFQPPITIGNDVWIGQEVLFRGGIVVGDGAVIAARSVVTKNVAPYTVVGGVPARIIRNRFPETIVRRLQQTEWWQYNFVDLPTSWSRIDDFLDDLEAMISADAIKPWRPGFIDLGSELLFVSL